MHKLGLEAEFIFLRRDGSATTRKDILGVWNYFIQKGWKEKRDPYNNELLGVKRQTKYGPLIMDNDGSAILLEVAWPPYPDLGILKREVRALIRDLNSYCGEKYRIIGYGCAPFIKEGTPALTPKGYYSTLLKLVRGAKPMWPFYICGALQVNIGGTLPELLRAYNTFAALTGIFFALGANASMYDNKRTRYRDVRGHAYDALGPYLKKGYHVTTGIPEQPFRSWKEYFLDLLSRPGHLLTIGDHIVEVLDPAPLIEVLRSNKPIRVREVPKTYFASSAEKKEYERTRTRIIHLEARDIGLIQSLCWRDDRLKFAFQPEVDTKHFVKAIQSSAGTFEKFLEKNLSNAYVEIRPVALQQPNDFLALPAFALGIMQNLSAAEVYIKKYPWSFWRELRTAAYTKGVQASLGHIPITKLLLPVCQIAEQGLKDRAMHEEKLLAPLYERIEKQYTPADVAERIFVQQGKKAFLEALTFAPEKIY